MKVGNLKDDLKMNLKMILKVGRIFERGLTIWKSRDIFDL